MWLLLSLFIVTVSAATVDNAKTTVKKDSNTSLLIFGTRHGNRNPEQFVLNETELQAAGYGFEGSLELTKFGKLEAYFAGQEIRKFMDDFVNVNYLPKESKFYSSSANRCQMTLQALLAGIYTPVKWADWTSRFANWSPVPYTIDDPLLRMYSISNCPVSDKAWEPISDDTTPDLKKMLSDNTELLQYMANNTGWEPSISKAADLADNFILMKLNKVRKYPSWIEKPTLKKYTKATLINQYMKFAEAHQIECVNYEPCRVMMGGYWLKSIVDNLWKNVKGTTPKLIGYASHTEVTLAVMRLLGYSNHELPTGAGFIIELRKAPTPQIRLLDHTPKNKGHIIAKAQLLPALAQMSDSDGWISLETFDNIVKTNFIADWEGSCGRECECPIRP